MNNQEFKIKLLDALMARNVWFQRPSQSEFRTRCPWCGDTQKRLDDGHLYLRIDTEDNYPVVYNCFKCTTSGQLKKADLEMLDIDDETLYGEIDSFNKNTDKVKASNTVLKDLYFDYTVPESFDPNKIRYLEYRLGIHFTEEDLMRMKVVTSLYSFVHHNKLKEFTCKESMARYVDQNYIGFLSSNNAYILFRDITEKANIRWYKYPITEESKGQKLYYTVQTEMDLFHTEDIHINLSEGVMDCLSIWKNFNADTYALNIAVCGKYYENMMRRVMMMGFIGSNICYHIYVDRDYSVGTSMDFLKKKLSVYLPFVKSIDLIYNMKEKDCGVRKELIQLQKYRL